MKKTKTKLFHKLSVKSKFLMIILGVAVICISVIGYQGLDYGKSSLTKSMYDHLTSIKTARAQQTENYFNDTNSLLKTLVSEYAIVDAMKEFSAGFSLLDSYKVELSKDYKKIFNFYYEKELIPALNKVSATEFGYSTLVPKKESVEYLQLHYIVNNAAREGKKYLLDDANDGSYYSQVHKKFNPVLRKIVENQDFSDLFLINAKSRQIVYSSNKHIDFATSLLDGPYKDSPLAKLAHDIIQKPQQGRVYISDFAKYVPAMNQPRAFLAIPIYQKHEFLGILAIAISNKKLNKITTGDREWEKAGLGKSGEVYIIGNDNKMRTESRELIQNPKKYLQELNNTKEDPKIVATIAKTKSTVLAQKIHSKSAKLALKGESGTIVDRNCLGVKVLSSYEPLNIDGLNWAILAQKSIKEAEAPIRELQNALLVSATILATLITFYAIWIAYSFLSPVNRMVKGVKSVIFKDSREKINLNRDDEFGELADNIDIMIDKLSEQEKNLEEKSKENDALLLNILPEPIVNRVKNGEKHIAERVNNVAVLFSVLRGFDQLALQKEPQESIELLNELINQFDKLNEQFGIEKITTIGDSYMSASGLIQPRLDYARRVCECALKMFDVVENFNAIHASNIQLSIGVDGGEVMSGIVGEYKYVYDIWGEPVNNANRISQEAHPGTLRVSLAIYKQLIDQEKYKQCSDGTIKSYAIAAQSIKS